LKDPANAIKTCTEALKLREETESLVNRAEAYILSDDFEAGIFVSFFFLFLFFF